MKWLVPVIAAVLGFTGLLILGMGFSISAFPGTDLAARALELKLLGAFFIASPWAAILLLRLKFRKDNKFHESILSSGTRKKAVLVHFEETGTFINNAPEVRMVLQIPAECGSSQVFTGVVPLLEAGKLQPGMELDITESEKGMVVHWR